MYTSTSSQIARRRAASLLLLASCTVACQSSHAAQWWGFAAIGAGSVQLGSTPAQRSASGTGATIDLGGGIVLAQRWQLGVDAGTLVRSTSFCGAYCTPSQQQSNVSFDHYMATVRFVPGDPAGHWFGYVSAGSFTYSDGHATGPANPLQAAATARQGTGTGAEVGVGYVIGGRGDHRKAHYVWRLAEASGHISPAMPGAPAYALQATRLSIGAEFW